MLPPIIFEAGYSLQTKQFFDNIVAITLYAMFGTLISTFIVGYLTFYSAKIGIIRGVDKESPMEALLFGALISAVDPVATLSIMGSPELQCNELLYSLVFGESVLNDAIAIVLFKTFLKYYEDDEEHSLRIVEMLVAFIITSGLSIIIGISLGLLCSFIYKHTRLNEYHHLEMSLLFLFCYGCYATAEAVGLSGIMALFFNGIVLRHYNSYNLSKEANVTAEQIFGTLAVISETLVFLYMGMGVFTDRYISWNFWFAILALVFCLIGRALNIIPLSFVANLCRRNSRKNNRITWEMQTVLWFTGLRGAIAYALSENMPGPNKDNYVATTLFICVFTTLVCGGYTERILTAMGMKTRNRLEFVSEYGHEDEGESNELMADFIDYSPLAAELVNDISSSVQNEVKTAWNDFDDKHLKPLFGGRVKKRDDRSRQTNDIDNNRLHDQRLVPSSDSFARSNSSSNIVELKGLNS